MGVKKRGKKWTARVHLGNQRYDWLGTFTTKEEAQEAYDKAANAPPQSRESCDSFGLRWVDDYPRPRETTNQTNRYAAERFAEDFKGVRMRDITRPQARDWALRNRAYLPPVRAMFSDAMNDGILNGNPFTKLRIPQSRGRKDLIAMTIEDVERLYEISQEHHGAYGLTFGALIVTAALTGMRPGELCAMRWDWIDWQAEEVTVKGRRAQDGLEDLPKNGKVRTVVLPPRAQEALKAMVRRTDTDYVFTGKQGKPLAPKSSLYFYWNPVRGKFGRPQMALYELRHFCATYLLELGMDPSDVAEQLGHEDHGWLVQNVYGHPSREKARERIKRAFREPVPLRAVSEDEEAAHGDH